MAGRAFVLLYANDTPLYRGLKMAERRVQQFAYNANRIGRSMLTMAAARRHSAGVCCANVRQLPGRDEGGAGRHRRHGPGSLTSSTRRPNGSGPPLPSPPARVGRRHGQPWQARVQAGRDRRGDSLGPQPGPSDQDRAGRGRDDRRRHAPGPRHGSEGDAARGRRLDGDGQQLGANARRARRHDEVCRARSPTRWVSRSSRPPRLWACWPTCRSRAPWPARPFAKIMGDLANTDTQEKLHEVGVEALNADRSLRPLGDVMVDLGQAMARMTNAERIAFAQDMFGERAYGAALKTQQGRIRGPGSGHRPGQRSPPNGRPR